MTKVVKTVAEAVTETLVDLSTVSGPEVDTTYRRESALGYAIQFHKTNGGMMTAPQLVAQAETFLDYILGENK